MTPKKKVHICRLSSITILKVLRGLFKKSICTMNVGIPATGLTVTVIFYLTVRALTSLAINY